MLPPRSRIGRVAACVVVPALAACAWPLAGAAQLPAPPLRAHEPVHPTALAELLARVTTEAPAVLAARERVRAAAALVGPAGLRPDPMLMAGVQNVPIAPFSLSADMMTMSMVGVSQLLPTAGKRALRVEGAAAEVDAARSALRAATLAASRDLALGYVDAAVARATLAILARREAAAAALVPAAQARYASGTATQADVLRARLDVTDAVQEASAVAEEGRAALERAAAVLDAPLAEGDALAELPATLDRALPARLLRAALGDVRGDTTATATFASRPLGARRPDSPLAPVDSLLALARARSPLLAEREADVTAQRVAVDLARVAHIPDVDVGLQYGRRLGRPDMVSLVVSLPLPLQRGRAQEPRLESARAELSAREAEHLQTVAALRADIARLVGRVERGRAQLVVQRDAVIPEARAATHSALAGYRAGRGDLLSTLETLRLSFTAEATAVRMTADVARAILELEALIGAEVVR